MKEIEIWKSLDFLGYPNYMVSNMGNVMSLNYLGHGKKQLLKQIKNSHGYLLVALYSNDVPKRYLVHRLVALAFLPNPNNLPQINHKNEIRDDNRLSNLEWCDNTYNCNYGNHKAHLSESLKGVNVNHPSFSKKVKLVLFSGKTLYYPSARETERVHELPWGTVSKSINTNNGFYKPFDMYFEYIDEIPEIKEEISIRPIQEKLIKVIVTDSLGNVYKFSSGWETERCLGLPKNTVSACVNLHNGNYKKRKLHFEYLDK